MIDSFIFNRKPVKQRKSFVDQDHEVMHDYYDLLRDNSLSEDKLLEGLSDLIKEDKNFYDTYVTAADILFGCGKESEALDLLRSAYAGAVATIVDAKGRWPKEMLWGYLENRHIMRALENYAIYCCWEEGKVDEALDIFKKLLQVNPNDNQGVRYHILAIRMGLSLAKCEAKFEIEQDGSIVGLDGRKMHAWFFRNCRKFPEDFEAWFKIVEPDRDFYKKA